MSAPQFDKRSMATLAVSHTVNDINQGAVPALLPFLIAERGLSYTAAAGVVLAATVISAVVQPLLGYYADKRSMPWLLPVGMLLGSIGLALAGLVDNYWLIIAAVLLSGAGVAAYHPEGYRFANYLARERPAVGMSVFTVGGNVGFALGPLLLTILIGSFGLRGTLGLLPLALIMSAVIFRALPRFAALRPSAAAARLVTEKPNWKAFSRITMVIVLRASLYYGLLSFIPSYLITMRGMPLQAANSALTVLSISGAIGTLIGGVLADRFGQKRVLLGLLALITPLLGLFMVAPDALALASLSLVGLSMLATFTIAVVLGQSYAGTHIGVASGITTGLAIGIGGASTPLYGLVADSFGVSSVMLVLMVLPLIALAIATTLPIGKRAAAAPLAAEPVAEPATT